MQKGPETNPNFRLLSLNRVVFDGMASTLLRRKNKKNEITRITGIISLEEALSELRKCGVKDKDMADYLDKWEQEKEEEFNKNPRS